MKNFYIKIDDEFLQNLTPFRKEKLEKIIMGKKLRRDGYSIFLRLCPYCNKFTLLSVPIERTKKAGIPKNCAICGETNPFDKILLSSEKADVLCGLAISYTDTIGASVVTEEDLRNGRTLMEQAIVVLATGLEIFLRDIYSSGMNLKYIKSKHTLFAKFANESKNDFINVDKTQKRFKSGLNIELKKVFHETEVKKINELFLKRNVIVHNNGFVDEIFLNQSEISCKMGELVPITEEDLIQYYKIIDEVVKKIENEFEKIIYPEIDIRIEDL